MKLRVYQNLNKSLAWAFSDEVSKPVQFQTVIRSSLQLTHTNWAWSWTRCRQALFADKALETTFKTNFQEGELGETRYEITSFPESRQKPLSGSAWANHNLWAFQTWHRWIWARQELSLGPNLGSIRLLRPEIWLFSHLEPLLNNDETRNHDRDR
jgi:hypothetical protein